MTEDSIARNALSALRPQGWLALSSGLEAPKDEVEQLVSSPRPDIAAAQYWRLTLLTLALTLGLGTLVAALSHISVSVIAEGDVSVDGRRRPVQALEAGSVASVAVAPGDTVMRGDVVMRLDSRAKHDRLLKTEKAIITTAARAARLLAEAEGATTPADVAFTHWSLSGADPLSGSGSAFGAGALSADIDAALRSERGEFAARYAVYTGKLASLRATEAEMQSQLRFYGDSRTAMERQVALLQEEEDGIRTLLEKALVPKPRLLNVQARKEGVASQLASLAVQISGAEQRLISIRNDLAIMPPERKAAALGELQAVRATLRGLENERTALVESVDSATLYAPETGTVLSVTYRSAGNVVRPGEVLMEIVPGDAPLNISAQILPVDVENVFIGAPVRIQFTSIRALQDAQFTGTIQSVTTDATYNEAAQQSFFEAVVALDDGELARIESLQASLGVGIPATVYIDGGTRTILSYLTDPITKIFDRGMREE